MAKCEWTVLWLFSNNFNRWGCMSGFSLRSPKNEQWNWNFRFFFSLFLPIKGVLHVQQSKFQWHLHRWVCLFNWLIKHILSHENHFFPILSCSINVEWHLKWWLWPGIKIIHTGIYKTATVIQCQQMRLILIGSKIFKSIWF